MAPEHKRLNRYATMTLDDILALPVAAIVEDTAHLYLWVPNALLPEGLRVLAAWGFEYKSNIVWHKIRKDGGPDGRGVGFYFRNTTELILFGVRGKNARTLAPGRRQVNIIKSRKREHSRKPDEAYELIEACSPGPFLEMFARGSRAGWSDLGPPGRRVLARLADLRPSLAGRRRSRRPAGEGLIEARSPLSPKFTSRPWREPRPAGRAWPRRGVGWRVPEVAPRPAGTGSGGSR
jgi:N6-adenosine-specific RNA methylase IME4